MYAYIARQPIFDRVQNVVGYELLYRDGSGGNTARILDGDVATRGVLSDAITVFGIPNLTDGRPAHINFTKNLLLNDFALLADPRQIVVEVEGDDALDPTLAEKLRSLRKTGYTLAMEGYTGQAKYDNIFRLFHIIRVDMRRVNELQLKAVAHKLDRIKVLAEKVESEEDYNAAYKMGFHMFQGYYFAKPKRMSRRIPSLAASSYGLLLNELLQPEVDFDVCCRIIESDVALTYMFMRQVQTANYYRGNRIRDIRQGITMMGTEEMQRWICLVMVQQNNVSHSNELPRRAYLRGLFIQRLMEASPTKLDPRQGFLMGMFSMLDLVLGVQLPQLLKDLDLPPAVKTALMGGEENEYSLFLQYAVIYEMANARLTLPDLNLSLKNENDVSKLYMKCVAEADAAFQRIGGHT